MGSCYNACIYLRNYYCFYKATLADPSCLFIAAQKRLRELKSKISSQSKKNFVLERDVRYLDSRIALLIANVSVYLPDEQASVSLMCRLADTWYLFLVTCNNREWLSTSRKT